MFDRRYAGTMATKLARPYVHLIVGARQTGNSTLLRALLPPDALVMDMAAAEAFAKECRALPATKKGQFVFVDEAQSVPSVFNAVLHLYDGDNVMQPIWSRCDEGFPPAANRERLAWRAP